MLNVSKKFLFNSDTDNPFSFLLLLSRMHKTNFVTFLVEKTFIQSPVFELSFEVFNPMKKRVQNITQKNMIKYLSILQASALLTTKKVQTLSSLLFSFIVFYSCRRYHKKFELQKSCALFKPKTKEKLQWSKLAIDVTQLTSSTDRFSPQTINVL